MVLDSCRSVRVGTRIALLLGVLLPVVGPGVPVADAAIGTPAAVVNRPAGDARSAAPDDAASPPKPRAPRRPDLTDPIICLNVRGFRDFVPRDEPSLTRDQKLEIYYEPFNFMIVRDPDAERPYRAHLVQDVRIRRAGNARPLQSLQAAIDYEPRAKEPPTSLYLHTTVALKDLPPGPYEIDLILRDELAEDRPETVRTVPFRVVSGAP